MKRPPLIYLASPYSHPDPAVVEARVARAEECTAALIAAGRIVFSPVVYSHGVVRTGLHLPQDWPFWAPLDLAMLRRSDAIWVLALEGVLEGRGVAAEALEAKRLGLVAHVLRPPRVPLSAIPPRWPGERDLFERPVALGLEAGTNRPEPGPRPFSPRVNF